MTRTILISTALAAITLASAAVALGRTDSAPTLNGTVGPGFTISLAKSGKKVTSLKAGSYKFVVADKAAIHNFVLEKEKGGTFERAITSVPFNGTKTVTIKLTAGTWKYYCKPHESMMHGEFKVK